MVNRIAVILAAALCMGELAYGQATDPASSEPGIPSPSTAAADTTMTQTPQPAIGETGPVPGDEPARWWGSADYLLGWMRGSRLPPLVTSSPTGTARGSAGVIGQPGTAILFGDTEAAADIRSGIRLDLGAWFDREHTWGIDAGFFMVESQANLFFSNSPDGNTILARPFINATTGAPVSQLVAFPGLATGSITGSYRSDNLFGANLDLQEVVLACEHFRVESILGYRYLQFNDRLAMDTSQTALGGGVVATGTQVVVSDRISASDTFHGGDFGLRAEYLAEGWNLGLLVKLAVGSVHRSVGISGATTITVPGSVPVTSSGGFLALSSNSGVFGSSDWVVAPEFGVNFGWNLSSSTTLRLGYSVLLWSDVARSVDQIDLTINPALFPPVQTPATPSRPAFQLVKSDIWLQTLSLGVEYRY
jgi:hypothetical protein